MSGMGSASVTGALWTATLVLALPAVWRLTTWDSHLAAVWTLALTPWLTIPSVGLVLAAAVGRRLGVLLAAVTLLVLYVTWTSMEVGVGAGSAAGSGAGSLSLATVNLLDRNPLPEQTADYLLGLDVDVLVLQELTPVHERALRDAGVLAEYDQAVMDVRERPDASAILSREALTSGRVDPIGTMGATTAVLRVGDREVRIINVHPAAPTSTAQRRRWARELQALREVLAAEPRPTIVVGDFNATGFHREFREVMQAGTLTDAHRRGGRGLGFTWPAGAAIPPVLRLDRVLLPAELGHGELEYLDVPGSDHKGVRVTVFAR
jgi:endonuclease/exonuclease/phosphatase family metal-dependent hydrolase